MNKRRAGKVLLKFIKKAHTELCYAYQCDMELALYGHSLDCLGSDREMSCSRSNGFSARAANFHLAHHKPITGDREWISLFRMFSDECNCGHKAARHSMRGNCYETFCSCEHFRAFDDTTL